MPDHTVKVVNRKKKKYNYYIYWIYMSVYVYNSEIYKILSTSLYNSHCIEISE